MKSRTARSGYALLLLIHVFLISVGMSEMISGMALDITVHGNTMNNGVAETWSTQGADSIYSTLNVWIITLDAPVPKSVVAEISVRDKTAECRVERVVVVPTRLFMEFACELDAAVDKFNHPLFIANIEKRLSQYGDVLVEENDFYSHGSTQYRAPWGVDRVDERDLPLDGAYNYDYDGHGVEIMVIDTGIRSTHWQFGGRARNVFNAVTGQNDTRANTDCHGHGTFVASKAAGKITGTAKGATILGVVALDCNGEASKGMFLTALTYAERYARVNSHKKIVVNLSLGGEFSPMLNLHTNSLAALPNVIVVVAAGNEANDACFRSPASANLTMTVGATDQWDGLASFSNTGKCVNITAPGVRLVGASHRSDVGVNIESGTSFSAPLVAGVVAMAFQQAVSANESEKIKEIVYNWARVRSFVPQIMRNVAFDSKKSGIDFAHDITDDIMYAERSYNYPFVFSRINLLQPPPYDNVVGNDPIYMPNTAASPLGNLCGSTIIAFACALVVAVI